LQSTEENGNPSISGEAFVILREKEPINENGIGEVSMSAIKAS
jgi:hypothetical protein